MKIDHLRNLQILINHMNNKNDEFNYHPFVTKVASTRILPRLSGKAGYRDKDVNRGHSGDTVLFT